MEIFPSKGDTLVDFNPDNLENKVSITFYQKPRQNPIRRICISNSFCSTVYNVQNTAYTQYTIGHDCLVKPFHSEVPQTFFSHMILIKFGQDVANKILHLTISTILWCYRILLTSLETPRILPKWPFLNLANSVRWQKLLVISSLPNKLDLDGKPIHQWVAGRKGIRQLVLLPSRQLHMQS